MRPWWTPFWSCPVCGREPQTRLGIGARCAARLHPSPQANSLFAYERPMQRLVQVFRSQNFLGAEKFLAWAIVHSPELAKLVDAAEGIALAPSRGASTWRPNRLAQVLVRALPQAKQKLIVDLLEKDASRAQHTLDFQHRTSGGIFVRVANHNAQRVRGKRWLVIDDIQTTGTTLAQCQTALFDAGAVCVATFTLALSLPEPLESQPEA